MTNYAELLQKNSLSTMESKEVCNALMTEDPRMEKLILKYFQPNDYMKIWQRRIGDGLIGGKACGMVMAQKLLSIYLPDCKEHLTSPDSWFIGSHVFHDYVAENQCEGLWRIQTLKKEDMEEIKKFQDRLLSGKFSSPVIQKLEEILDNYGQTPLFIRSSSLMEDSYENAFTGKYDSVICANQGTKAERMAELLNAVRSVYASVLNLSALEYRKKRHLLNKEEHMALIIQTVAGSTHGQYFFPAAAGMGCSYNPYKWMEQLNPKAGMLRIVMGLGTRAVEQTPGDYPRLVGLDRARANLHPTIAERHKYSQRHVDVIDLAAGGLCTKSLEDMTDLLPKCQRNMLLSHDTEAETLLAQRRIYRNIYFADCQGLVENSDFITVMRKALNMFEKEYERPVDVEFAVDTSADGSWHINIYQCRPLRSASAEGITISGGVEHEFLFDITGASIGRSEEKKIDYIVWVDPQKYYECPYSEKPNIGRMIGKINQKFKDTDNGRLLLTPGRIGTTSPELGVPVAYADISQFCAVCEVAYEKAGYFTDLSYGSHMFQDMVEAGVFYGAITKNRTTKLYRPEMLKQYPEILHKWWPDAGKIREIVKLYDLTGLHASIILDARAGRAVCRIFSP